VTHAYTHTRTNTHAYKHTYIQTHIQTHTHTHTHTYKHTRASHATKDLQPQSTRSKTATRLESSRSTRSSRTTDALQRSCACRHAPLTPEPISRINASQEVVFPIDDDLSSGGDDFLPQVKGGNVCSSCSTRTSRDTCLLCSLTMEATPTRTRWMQQCAAAASVKATR